MPVARYYVHNPFAPQPNQPPRLGTAVVIVADGKVLLEQRRDSFKWGIVTGDLRTTETFRQCAIRRTVEETSIHIKDSDLHQIRMFDDPSRIVSFIEGNIYRLIHIAYYVELDEIPETACGKQSVELRWVDMKDLLDYEMVVTHQEILEEYLQLKGSPYTCIAQPWKQ